MSNHWASHAVEALGRGEQVVIRPRGNSMRPRVKSGAVVTLAPLVPESPLKDDVVLVKVSGRVFLHLVSATRSAGSSTQYQIANQRGHVNGWVSRSAIYGLAVDIDNS